MSSDRWFLDSTPTAKYPAWTRGNAADVFPGPFSPLAYDLILRDGMSKGLRDAYTSIGAINYDEYDNPERPDLFHVFGGYPYNPLTMTRIFGARMPGASPELIDKAFFDDRAEVPPYEEQAWHTSPDNEAKLAASMGWAMSATDLPELLADRELAAHLRANRPNLAELTDAALIARARSVVPFVQQTFENAMRVSTMSSLGPGALGAVCEGIGDPTAAIRLLAGIEVDSAAPSHAMWELGRAAAASPEVAKAFDTAGPDGVLAALEQMKTKIPGVVPPLLKRLPGADRSESQVIFMILAKQEEDAKPAIPAMIRVLSEADSWTQGNAIVAICQLKQHAVEALPEIVKLAGSDDEHVQSSAIRGLQIMGPAAKSVIPDLEKIGAASRSQSVKYNIRETIKRLNADPNDVDGELITALTEASSFDAAVKALPEDLGVAIQALGRICANADESVGQRA